MQRLPRQIVVGGRKDSLDRSTVVSVDALSVQNVDATSVGCAVNDLGASCISMLDALRVCYFKLTRMRTPLAALSVSRQRREWLMDIRERIPGIPLTDDASESPCN